MISIIISKSEYRSLFKAEALLNRLECVGVDNWDGWDEARGSEWFEGVSYSDEKEAIDEVFKD